PCMSRTGWEELRVGKETKEGPLSQPATHETGPSQTAATGSNTEETVPHPRLCLQEDFSKQR
ncbi:hypothetical protein PCASD_26675, partial [Puccinia coronata f. sp. avenae]